MASMLLVDLLSVAVWNMMLTYQMFSSSFSLSLASSGMSASGIDLGELLVSGFNCRLILLGNLGSNLAVLSCSLIQLTSWTSLHLPTIISVAIGNFLVRLQVVLLMFIIGMFSILESCVPFYVVHPRE